MLNITLPHIAVQKVTNGYVIQWQVREPNRQLKNKTAVCLDEAALLECIKQAAAETAVAEL